MFEVAGCIILVPKDIAETHFTEEDMGWGDGRKSRGNRNIQIRKLEL